MSTSAKHRNAEVLDILFAVALSEGFISGIYEYKDLLVSGEIFTWGAPGQGLYRILLGFLIIILSWLHFRSETMIEQNYPRGEFVVDVLVAVTYMTLFLFTDAPATFYTVIAIVWFLYTVARYFAGYRRVWYLACGFAFAAAFLAAAYSTRLWEGNAAEWSRLLLVTAVVIVYRPIDARLRPKALAAAG